MNGFPLDESVNALRLGPIVGHTDHESTRIWIQVLDDPSLYRLRVQGRGMFDFAPTEPGGLEFGTGIAVADGLRPDHRYRYQVLRRGRIVRDGRGTFQTLPDPTSMAEILFAVISCNNNGDEGLWRQLGSFVEDANPRFLLFIGDNIYMDQSPNVWEGFLKAGSSKRRAAMADQYHLNWSRPYVREVLANVPTYMIWDDHDIRDGWGSLAGDGLTLAEQYPRSAPITDLYRQYFEDARDLYWHFQMCRNPLPDYVSLETLPGYRRAIPVTIRCGRLQIVMVDSRGDRDVFRQEKPILGTEQWSFLDKILKDIDPDIDALVVVTPVPIVCMDPEGQTQFAYGGRTDDIHAYRSGSLDAVEEVRGKGGEMYEIPLVGLAAQLRSTLNVDANWGAFKVSDIDDVRDQWCHAYSRPEQEELIRKVVAARLSNRIEGSSRSLMFVGGDLHAGAMFDVTVDDAELTVPCLIASGISKRASADDPLLSLLFDKEFEVASGINARLKNAVPDYNYGVVQVIPTGHGAAINGIVVHKGNASSYGIDLWIKPGP